MPGFDVIRCWKFGSLHNPARLLNTIRQLNPDVVWYHLVFSTFATPDKPLAAFAGLSAPALTRAAGFYTHITLHHLIEHVDFLRRQECAGNAYSALELIWQPRRCCRANSVSVLLPVLSPDAGVTKYSAENVLLGTHGIFALGSQFRRTLAGAEIPINAFWPFGHWGTYKRLETLMQAFPLVLKKAPRARLIVAGSNHYTRPGYWESIRAAQPPQFPIEFRGYVPEEAIPELLSNSFRRGSALRFRYWIERARSPGM